MPCGDRGCRGGGLLIEMMCRLEERRRVFSALGAGHPN